MTGWEQRLLALFDDLEQQAEGLALAERDARVAELSRAEYGELDLASRLHAAVGAVLLLDVAGVGRLRGTVVRVGADWVLVDDGAHTWLVRQAALEQLRGLPDRALDAAARPVAARLGLGSALRSIAADAGRVVVHGAGGGVLRGRVRRVGADFVEVDTDEPAEGMRTSAGAAGLAVLTWSALAAVRRA